MIEKMRAEIEALGGEIRFRAHVTDLRIEGGAVRGVVLEDGSEIEAEHVILALGHSARHLRHAADARGVFMEPKPFSVGFRIEHPQSIIDKARFGSNAGHPLLGAADYKLVHHAKNGRSVYSFCMCPGGTVVAATSEPGRVVTNGMSQYSRNERNANAGIVVGITPGTIAGMAAATAPSTRSTASPSSARSSRALRARRRELRRARAARSRLPRRQGLARLRQRRALVQAGRAPHRPRRTRQRGLPPYAIAAIREGRRPSSAQIRGFAMPDAVLTGVETHLLAAAHHART